MVCRMKNLKDLALLYVALYHIADWTDFTLYFLLHLVTN